MTKESLEKAVNEFWENYPKADFCYLECKNEHCIDGDDLTRAFIAGVVWAEQQRMKEVVELVAKATKK